MNEYDGVLDAILTLIIQKAKEAQHYNGHHVDPTGYKRDKALKSMFIDVEMLKEQFNKREGGNDPV